MFDYLQQYFQSPRETGALRSSTRMLGEAAVQAAHVSQAKAIVELGSGNGVFTEVIQEQRSADSNFFVIEINERFVDQTRERCPDVQVYHDSAEYLGKYLEQEGINQVEAIISGIPWAMLPNSVQEVILGEVVKYLAPGGRFTTIALLGSPLTPGGQRFRKLLEEHFSSVEKTDVVWENKPPARHYICVK